MSSSQTSLADLQERQDEAAAGEHTPLVVSSLTLARRYRSTRKCVSSKAALLILVWSFVIGLLGGMLLNPKTIIGTLFPYYFMQLSMYGGTALVTCFFPLAGILADIRFGHYKTIITSIYLVLLSLLLLILSNIFWVLLVSDKSIEAIVALLLFSVCAGISGPAGSCSTLVLLVSLLMWSSLVWTNSTTPQEKRGPSSYTGMCGHTMAAY